MASQKLSALASLAGAQVPTDLIYIADLSAGAAGSKSSTLNDAFSIVTKNITDGALRFQGFAPPAVSGAGQGAIYYDTADNKFKVSENAGAYINLGDISGPAAATDEAIARFDGVTGKLLQNSVVTITDAGAFANALIEASTNVLGAVTMTLTGDGTGDVYYRSAGGLLTRLGIGTAAQVLTVSGGGLPSWATPASAIPGGADTQIQFNNAGAFGGVSGATSNGTAITFTADNLIATSPHFITSIDDTNGNPLFLLTAVGSSVNQFTVANAATGAGPTLSATGADPNIPINVSPQGTGVFNSTGPLRLSGTVVDQFVTPGGSSVPTKINVPLFDPGSFGQIIAMGLNSAASSSARVICVNDQRAAGHQPSIAVVSPGEGDIFGFTWDGQNTAGFLSSTTGILGMLGTEAYFGNGVLNGAPASYIINATGGSGTNIAGANLDLAAGKGTGNGIPGLVSLRYPLTLGSGTTLQSLSTARFPLSVNAWTSVADVSVANTTAETTLFGNPSAGSTRTIEAGMPRAGQTYEINLGGTFVTTGSPTLQIRLKLGSTTIIDFGAQTVTPTVSRWEFKAYLTVRTLGATGTATVEYAYFNYTGAGSGSGAITQIFNASGPLVVNWTAAQVVDVTAQWGAASVSNDINAGRSFINIYR